MSKHTIPILLGVADVLAASVAFYHKDVARAWYWLSAASITFSTVVMKG